MAKHQEGTFTRDTDTGKKFDSIEDAEKDLLNTDTDNESTESIAEEIQASILDTDSQVDSQVDSQNEDKDWSIWKNQKTQQKVQSPMDTRNLCQHTQRNNNETQISKKLKK